ncbi:MAG: Cytidylate kinase [Mycoplasmataceae bacterium]|nr:MAG: Cytidylate kinase [Mycoplasmataceae bacterium]
MSLKDDGNKKMVNKINIAIDGPAGSGKTTVGLLLSKKLNYKFLDSGLLYRHFAYFFEKNKFFFDKAENLIPCWNHWLKTKKKSLLFDLEKERKNLNSSEVNNLVPHLSQIPKLRKIILLFQRELTQSKGWIVIGRDITSVVLPKAEIKVFLTASLDERVKRRGNELDLKKTKQEMQERDKRDKTRKISPLIKTLNSWELDNTNLSVEESVEKILTYFYKLKLKNWLGSKKY